MENIVTIKNLNISFFVYGGQVNAVTNLSLHLKKKEVYALVGESGCGKSSVANAVVGLLDTANVHIKAEKLHIRDTNLLQCSTKQMELLRQEHIGMIFQNPLSSLNPTMKIGKQIVEILYRRKKLARTACKEEAIRLLTLVQIPDPEIRFNQFPHELSGGMIQRIMIAMALVSQPELLIADEPTTSLDVTTQLAILQLLKDIQKIQNTSILFITHDFGVVAHMADRIGVMYAGEIVEEGSVEDIFYHSIHPYTQSLLKCLPGRNTKELFMISGEPPDVFEKNSICPFAQRCQECMNICMREKPQRKMISEQHFVTCFQSYR